MDRSRLKLVDLVNTNKRFGDCTFPQFQFRGEGDSMAVNHKYLACIWNGVGSTIAVFNKFHPKRIPPNVPLVRASMSNPTDIAWSPFFSNLLCVATEEGTIKLYQVPEEEYFKTELKQEVLKYGGQSKKIQKVKFHPCSKDIIASCSVGRDIHVWDVTNGQTLDKIYLPEIPTCLEWNNNGSLLGTSCQNGDMFIIDPRSEKIVNNMHPHLFKKPGKMIFLERDYFMSAGFFSNSEREIKIFDLRNARYPCITKQLDKKSSTPYPWYDIDTGLLIIPSRGDYGIHFFEFNGQLNYIKEWKDDNKVQFRNYCHSEKRHADYRTNEYFEVYRENKEFIDIFSLRLTKHPNFDSTLFPPTFNGVSVISAREWKSGQNADYQVSRVENIAAGNYVKEKIIQREFVEPSSNPQPSSTVVTTTTYVQPQNVTYAEPQYQTQTQTKTVTYQEPKNEPQNVTYVQQNVYQNEPEKVKTGERKLQSTIEIQNNDVAYINQPYQSQTTTTSYVQPVYSEPQYQEQITTTTTNPENHPIYTQNVYSYQPVEEEKQKSQVKEVTYETQAPSEVKPVYEYKETSYVTNPPEEQKPKVECKETTYVNNPPEVSNPVGEYKEVQYETKPPQQNVYEYQTTSVPEFTEPSYSNPTVTSKTVEYTTTPTVNPTPSLYVPAFKENATNVENPVYVESNYSCPNATEPEQKVIETSYTVPVTKTEVTYVEQPEEDVDPNLPLSEQVRILKQKLRETRADLAHEREENKNLRDENFKYRVKLGI